MQVDASTLGQTKVEAATPSVHPWPQLEPHRAASGFYGSGALWFSKWHGYLGYDCLASFGEPSRNFKGSPSAIGAKLQHTATGLEWGRRDWQNGIENGRTCNGWIKSATSFNIINIKRFACGQPIFTCWPQPFLWAVPAAWKALRVAWRTHGCGKCGSQ